MNLKNELSKNNVINFHYYPVTDLSYSHNLGKLIENYNTINDYFSSYPFDEITFDHFIDYLLCEEFVKYKKDEKYFKQGFNDNINSLLNIFTAAIKSFKKLNWLCLLERAEIFSCLDSDTNILYYNFIKKHLSELSVLSVKIAINKFYYFFVDDVDSWLNYLIEEKLYIDVLENIEQLLDNRLEETLKLIEALHNKQIDVEEYIKKIDLLMEKCLISSIEDSLKSQIFYSTVLAYYKKMKLPQANLFENKYEIIDKKVDEWLKKRGHTLDFKVPYKKLIDEIESIPYLGLRVTYITHEKPLTKTNRPVSFYDNAYETSIRDRPLTDVLCVSNQKQSKSFDSWYQECLSLYEIIHLNILSYFIYTKNNEIYRNVMENFINTVADNIGEKKKNEMVNSLKEILDEISNINNTNASKKECELCSKHIVFFIEDLLKKLNYWILKDKFYVDNDNFTLGILIDPDRSSLRQIYSEKFLNGLRFYLSSEKNIRGEKVGLDWRNRMSHGGSMLPDEKTPTLCLRLMLILTTLINETNLYFSINCNK